MSRGSNITPMHRKQLASFKGITPYVNADAVTPLIIMMIPNITAVMKMLLPRRKDRYSSSFFSLEKQIKNSDRCCNTLIEKKSQLLGRSFRLKKLRIKKMMKLKGRRIQPVN